MEIQNLIIDLSLKAVF